MHLNRTASPFAWLWSVTALAMRVFLAPCCMVKTLHILESIERIEHYVAELDEQVFLSNKLVQDAVIRNFEVVRKTICNDLPDFYKRVKMKGLFLVK